jgi:hypothetical protein
MTNVEAMILIITVAMGLIALSSLGLYWIKWREPQPMTQVLFLVFGLCVAAGVLMLVLLVLNFPSV